MTQHVRTGYRKHRRATWVGALGALAALALAFVVPAIGADPTTYPPPSSPGGITPTANPAGGDTFACSSVRQGGFEIDLNNPKSGTTSYTFGPNNSTVQLQLKLSTGNVKDKYFSFKLTGAVASHVAVKGGDHVALYTYAGTQTGPVDADGHGSGTPGVDVDISTTDSPGTGLHAPLQPDGSPYSVSITSFCIDLAASISGTVWQDTNEDRQVGAAASEPRQAGWGVTAYKKGTSTPAATATSLANGTYSLLVPTGFDYWLCETRSDANTWGQSTPTASPSSPTQCDSETPFAISTGTVSGSLPNQNFGNLRTTSVTCDQVTNSTDNTDQVKPSSQCGKTTSATEVVFNSWSDATSQYVGFHPASGADCGPPSGSTCSYFVEKLTWTGLSNAQTPLKYDDKRDANGNLSFEDMRFCKKDPRSSAPDGLTLQSGTLAADVLPNVTRTDGDPSTSCLITSTNSVDASGVRGAVDIVFNVGDGYSGR